MALAKPQDEIRVGLIVPVYNVERTINKVLDRIDHSFLSCLSEVFIVNNCSTDQTVSMILSYLNDHPKLSKHVTLIQHTENYGYGCSIKAGLSHFASKADITHVMIAHGDYQVDPSWLIDSLVGSVKLKPDTDVVLASRFKAESNITDYSALRKLGNYFFNVATLLCTGSRMSDAGTAMIILRRETLEKVPFSTLSNSWQFHPQLNVILYSLPHIRIQEIPLNWSDSEAGSTVPLLRYGIILLRMLVMYWFKKNILKKKLNYAFPLTPVPSNRQYTVLN